MHTCLGSIFVLLAASHSNGGAQAPAPSSHARQEPAATAEVFRVVGGGTDVVEQTLATVRTHVRASLDTLSGAFPGPHKAFTVIVHRDRDSLPDAVRASLHEGTSGLAVLSRHEIHLILSQLSVAPPHDLRTVVLHELVHILLHQSAGEGGSHVPRWLHEGVAQVLSESTYLGASEEDIVLQAKTGNLLLFSQLRDGFPRHARGLRAAYAQSFSFVSFLRSKVGLEAVLRAARSCGPERTFAQAFAAETGRALIYLERDWVEYLKSGSGAAFRLLLTSCFSLALVGVLPLLVLAGARRWNRDHETAQRLARQDVIEDHQRTDETEERG